MKARTLVLLIALAFFLPLTKARAQSGQPWLDDRRYGQGIGVRTGDLELHPGIAAQLGYDSNYTQASGDVGFLDDPSGELVLNEPVVDLVRLRVTPSLSLKTLGEQRAGLDSNAAAPDVSFEASGRFGYDKLIVLDDSLPTRGVDDYWSAKAETGLKILPRGPVGADVNGSFERWVQPNNDAGMPPAFNREVFAGGFGVSWRPGGGITAFRLGYDASYTFFEFRRFKGYDNLQHGLQATAHWKFLPRTALLYEGRVGFIRYSDQSSALAEGNPVSTKLGISGLWSNHFAVLAMLGWMATFYEARAGSQEDYDGPLAQLQLTYYPSPQMGVQGQPAVGLSQVAFGYLRNIENAYLGNYVRRDRVYTDLSYFIGGKLVLGAQAGINLLGHPAGVLGDNPGPNDRTAAFSEVRADATGFAEVRTSNTIGFNLTLIYSSALNHEILRAQPENSVAPGAAVPADNLRFDRIEAWLGARWFL